MVNYPMTTETHVLINLFLLKIILHVFLSLSALSLRPLLVSLCLCNFSRYKVPYFALLTQLAHRRMYPYGLQSLHHHSESIQPVICSLSAYWNDG